MLQPIGSKILTPQTRQDSQTDFQDLGICGGLEGLADQADVYGLGGVELVSVEADDGLELRKGCWLWMILKSFGSILQAYERIACKRSAKRWAPKIRALEWLLRAAQLKGKSKSRTSTVHVLCIEGLTAPRA